MTDKLDVANTKTAFSHLSDGELKRAFWMFKMLSFDPVVRLGPLAMETAVKLHFPVKGLVKATFFHHFCGGETMSECEGLIQALKQSGVGSILDYSSEGGVGQEFFLRTFNEVKSSIAFATGRPEIPFCVVKPTGIADFDVMAAASRGDALSDTQKVELENATQRFRDLATLAAKSGVRLFVDAEETWIQNYVDSVMLDLMRQHNRERAIIFTTVQMYRHDRLAFLEELKDTASNEGFVIGVKLVRGAYLEKERRRAERLGYQSPIHATKQDTDQAYNAALDLIMDHPQTFEICAGTHNEESTTHLAGLIGGMKTVDSPLQRFQFAQLLGMGDHLTFNLAAAGYSTSKYIPYGAFEEVMPYLSRRARENSSVKGQTGRELALLSTELKRRQSCL